MTTRTVKTVNQAVSVAEAQGWQFLDVLAGKPTWTYQAPTIDNETVCRFLMRSPVVTELAERYDATPFGWEGYLSKSAVIRAVHNAGMNDGPGSGHQMATCKTRGACADLLSHMAEFNISLVAGKINGSIRETYDDDKIKLADLLGRIEHLKMSTSVAAIPAALEWRRLKWEVREAGRAKAEAVLQLETLKARVERTEQDHAAAVYRLEAAEKGATLR